MKLNASLIQSDWAHMRSSNRWSILLQGQLDSRAGIKIGHLDTGIDQTHPAVAGCVASFQRFDYRGRPEPSMSAHDSGWHGTFTAGLIAGGKADGCYLGVAPSAQLYTGTVLDEGDIIARILSGLDWLIDCDVRVVNLALGIPELSPIFRPMIQEMVRRDIIVVASIGNHGAGKGMAPGIYPEVISVGAIDDEGVVPVFSGSYHHYGTVDCHKPDLLAPGVDILSAVPDGGFRRESGTSMSTALVTGLVAALQSSCPHAPVHAIKQALIASCDPISPDQDHRTANGAVNPVKALEWLKDWDQAPDQFNLIDEPWHAEATLPDKFIDPRLDTLLHYRTDSDLCNAILWFGDWSGIERLKCFIKNHQTAPTSEAVQILKHAPYAICHIPQKLLVQILSWPELRYASACDIDRSFFM